MSPEFHPCPEMGSCPLASMTRAESADFPVTVLDDASYGLSAARPRHTAPSPVCQDGLLARWSEMEVRLTTAETWKSTPGTHL